MLHCVRGFIRVREGSGASRAKEVFKIKVEKMGNEVSHIISVSPVGDNVYAIVANVKYPDEQKVTS